MGIMYESSVIGVQIVVVSGNVFCFCYEFLNCAV